MNTPESFIESIPDWMIKEAEVILSKLPTKERTDFRTDIIAEICDRYMKFQHEPNALDRAITDFYAHQLAVILLASRVSRSQLETTIGAIKGLYADTTHDNS